MRVRQTGGLRDARGRVIAGMMLALACLALVGCAGDRAAILPVRGDFVIAIEHGEDVPRGTLFLKALPGGLLGKAAGNELFRSRPGAKAVQISASALAAQADFYARTARSDRFNPGELARPRELGIARIGTFYETASASPGCTNFRTGLDLETPGSAMLVYVDRPGSIRGARYTSPYVMQYHLDFPAAGVYVIAVRSRGIVVSQRVVNVARRISVSVQLRPCG